MKKRTLEEKIRLRMNKSNQTAFINSDFFDLSDQDQVGRVLRKMVQNEDLIKLGRGVFAKTKYSAFLRKKTLAGAFPDTARQALAKLKIKVFPSTAEREYSIGTSPQVPTGLMVGINKRVSRRISYNGRSIKYEQVAHKGRSTGHRLRNGR